MSEYTEQAEKFLTDHNLTFRAVHLDTNYFFTGDKEIRDIYSLTISGKNRGRITVKFGASIDMTHKGIKPTAYDMLTCITKSDPGDFEDFCDEYGYDMDSRAAEKTWKDVVKEWKKVDRFFYGSEILQMQEIS